MTEDEKIILHCLKFIRRATKYLPNGHVNMLTTLWKNWDEDKQNYFHGLLWDKKYVHLAPYQWELQLTDAGKDFIKEKDKELRDAFFTFLIDKRDVVEFMVNNFVKPNDLSPETKNETDDGVVFLKELRQKRLIRFHDAVLEQVNNWVIPKGKNKHKRWFDTLTDKLIIIPTNPAHEDSFLETNLPTKTPTITAKNTHRKTIQNGTRSNSIWKKEFMLYFVYPLFVILIGTILLKIFGVI